MSSNSIFSSWISELRWQDEMSKHFPQGNVVRLDVDHYNSPCVFRVPESFTQTKPEAYAPQQVGLGPYHHLRPDLYTMQRKKLYAVLKFLGDPQLQNFQLLVEDVTSWEPYLRTSYDHHLDLDPRTLGWIFAIDAMLLMLFLQSYQEGHIWKNFVGDILMLENQIPGWLLMEVFRRMQTVAIFLDGGEAEELLKQLSFFCGRVSPLELNKGLVNQVDIMKQGHLLHVMYQLIVTHTNKQAAFHEVNLMGLQFFDDLSRAVDILATTGVPGAGIVQQQLSLVSNFPWDRILGLFKPDDPVSSEKIGIPSVSQLTETARISFAPTEGGISDVKFNEFKKEFYLPVITLRGDSEVILRNLLAYEAASVKPGCGCRLAEYVDLMCGIVNTPKDVEILRGVKIIVSDLTDAEVATIFNGMKKLTGDKEEKTTDVEQVMEKVSKQYDNIPRIKVYKFIQKHVPTMVKFVRVFLVILLLALFVFQAFCQIYGCEKHWFKK